MQYGISLLVIVVIAAIDNYLIVEPVVTPAPADMVWINGSDFSADTPPGFTDRDTSQDFQSAGFWIDGDTVSRSEYEHFMDASGYAGTAPVQPNWLSAETSPAAAHMKPIYALRDETVTPGDERALHYVSGIDAIAYCNWRGLGILHGSADSVAAGHKPASGATDGITLHASQPMSQLSGFRCVKLPRQGI